MSTLKDNSPHDMNKYYTTDDTGRLTLKIHGVTEIALEPEGGWYNPHYEVHRDGSVNSDLIRTHYHDEDCDEDCNGGDQDDGQVGEIHIRGKVDDVLRELVKNYPDEIDGTCGLHIHISFAKDLLSYSKLMSPKFNRYFLKRIKQWAIDNKINTDSRFYKRLEGNNTYARNIFRPLKQYRLAYKESSRYSFLNYAWTIHGTLECRLFPMFDMPHVSVSAVKEFVSIVNEYLLDNIKEPVYDLSANVDYMI